MRKFVLTGPESTGKTTLARILADRLDGVLVPEHARAYINALSRPYTYDDLLVIAQGQIDLETRSNSDTKYLICDTDLLTIRIWAEVKFGQCHDWIAEQTESRAYDHYFLCAPDIPWVADPQRENPNDREDLFVRYENLLRALGKPYSVLRGHVIRRTENALRIIRHFYS